jgi:hypothetical protein
MVGETALHFSLAYGHDSITDRLLASGLIQITRSKEGKSPWDYV